MAATIDTEGYHSVYSAHNKESEFVNMTGVIDVLQIKKAAGNVVKILLGLGQVPD